MSEKDFDLKKIQNTIDYNDRYQCQLKSVVDNNKEVDRITDVVEKSIENIKKGEKSFVIYGEPQSGKTGMMIALTARLLDEGHKIIIVLLNDSVQLLEQNLERFQRSNLSPTPRKFNEIMSPDIKIDNTEWVIFSKKNARDLEKLNDKLSQYKGKIIIDDEADYATPNSKINKKKQSKINELTEKLIGDHGIYIGVTATPARLDLNRTHGNQNESWIDFSPHSEYTGQEEFFPSSLKDFPFKLTSLPDQGDDPKYLREALFRFMINVSYLNTRNQNNMKNYSFLIHTSGKKVDHSQDYKEIITAFEILKNWSHPKRKKFLERIYDIAKKQYTGNEKAIIKYVIKNSAQHNVVVMNSDKEKNSAENKTATEPAVPFTIIIGGNIVSRGVTFNNLLAMFFTRDVKNKIQQDTYIQRARMFGSRNNILKYFELTIPKQLYLDWQKCFIFHRLSLESIWQNGYPVWLGNKRISATAPRSIDKTRIVIDSGEMSFVLFDYSSMKESIIDLLEKDVVSRIEKVKSLSCLLGQDKLPTYLINYIENFLPNGDESIALHSPKMPKSLSDGDGHTNIEEIVRSRGFIGKFEREEDKYPKAIHHIMILYNHLGKARVFYKYHGNIKFLKTSKKI